MATTNKQNKLLWWGLGLIVLAGLVLGRGYIFGPKKDAASAAKAKAPPLVSITNSQTRDLPIKFKSQGHLVPLNQVDIRPQITGTIRSVHFHEGDDIKAGQLLFTLDASDATAQLNRVQAQVAQIKAQLDDANREYNRSKELVKSRFISSSAVDTSASKVESLQAQYRASQAEVESARVIVDRTRIVAPVSAKAGAVEVHPGSLAQQGQATPLVTLIQFDPIGVEFTLPEQNLDAVLAARANNTVSVSLETTDGQTADGQLVFVNNTVNPNTGTISLKASFANKKQSLWPGAFVRITVSAGYNKNAIVLPPQAVLEGPKGHFVYLIAENGKVTSKPVTLLRIQDQNAVVEGLKTGERVVVEGNQNLRSGMTATVDPKTTDPALSPSPEASTGK